MAAPIKSPEGFTLCGSCRAHIRAGATPSATDCPFCGVNLHRGSPTGARHRGRGGILAASLLALSTGGCGASAPNRANPAAEEADEQRWRDMQAAGDVPLAAEQETPAPSSSDSREDERRPDRYAPRPADRYRSVAEYGISPFADDY